MENNSLGAVRSPLDLVPEYDEKMAALDGIVAAHVRSISDAKAGATVAGYYGRESIFCCSVPSLSKKTMEASLLKSAWWAAYDWCNMKILATAADKKKIEIAFQNPVPFTVGNITATFGPYLADQREHILRGLAEAFITLDDAYKSHSKVKVGVKGLPKRIIINNVSTSRYGYGWEKLCDMLNALQVFDGDGLVSQDILNDISRKKMETYRGLTFKWFLNGNVHIHFSQHACLQINRGLAEYYGDVLPDVEPDKSDLKPDINKTDVSKDLQYYPTPPKVAMEILRDLYFTDGDRILEPSCGCGRIMDAIMERVRDADRRGWREPEPKIVMLGVEFSRERVLEAKQKGYKVIEANFLDLEPDRKFNKIIMNPPFYGKHYLKHINHALKFLEPGGVLVSILPAAAHYDHKMLPDGYSWRDLPVGSFAESGVRVPTGYATWRV